MTRRPLPLVTLALAAATLGAYALELAGGGLPVCEWFGLVPARLLATGDVLPLLSHLALHDPGHWVHLAGNVVCLALVGPLVERSVGGARMLTVYALGGVLGALTHVLCAPGATEPLVGCSGSLMALLAVAAVVRPRAWLAFTVVFVGVNLAQLVTASGGSVSVATHLGGFVAGAMFAALARARGTMPRRALIHG